MKSKKLTCIVEARPSTHLSRSVSFFFFTIRVSLNNPSYFIGIIKLSGGFGDYPRGTITRDELGYRE